MNDENKFLNLPRLKQYHNELENEIDVKIQDAKEEYVGFTNKALEEVT